MPRRIILDETGKSIWADPAKRLKEIKAILKPKLEDIAMRIANNEKKMYPAKLNFLPAITNLLDAYLRKTPLVRFDYAVDIEEETLQGFANAFFDLLIFIREYVPEYVANKQTFCAFASISVSAFNQLQQSQDGEIVAIIENLNDSFLETNISAAQGGATNATATFNRLRSRDVGHSLSLTQTGEENQGNTVVVLDNEMVKKQLSSMFGSKMLENKIDKNK